MPVGQSVVVQHRGKDKNEVWRVPETGKEAQRVDLGVPKPNEVRIHPDGRRVAFMAGESKSELWVMENFLPALKVAK
ncbi:MAG: hypothetical protein ABSF88_04610 [Candidatus Aminicenantales bacterium]